MRGASDHGARRQQLGLRKHVGVLPGKIIARHVQQHLGFATGIGSLIAEVLAADVHMRRQILERHFVVDHPARLYLVGIGSGRNDETVVADANGGDDRLGRLFRKHDADRGLVSGGLAVGGVVHLEHHIAAGLDAQSLPGIAGEGGRAGRVGGEPVAGAAVGLFHFDDRLPDGRVAQPLTAGLAHVGNDVMDHGAIAGPYFGRANPAVLGEIERDDEARVFHGAGGGDAVGLGHPNHHIRLAHIPTFDELAGGRRLLQIAGGRFGFRPRHQRVLLFFGERRIVAELTVRAVGAPGRHLLTQDGLTNGGGVGPRFLIGKERHRRSFARAMAALALVLQHGQDILIEGGGRRT